MNRLTERDKYGNARLGDLPTYGYRGLDYHTSILASSLDGLCHAVEKLAAYENTGLTPEEITAMKADNARLHKLVDNIECVMRGDHDERKTH